jgi:ABC-type spermidine/putrescine transport system permease subunit II
MKRLAKEFFMSTWIILAIIVVWLVLPAFLIIAACMNSSRLSRAEESLQSNSARRFMRQEKIMVSQQHSWEIARESEPARLPALYGEG